MKSQRGIARAKLLVVLAIIGIVVVTASAILLGRPNSQEQRSASNPTGYRAASDQFMNALTRGDAGASFNLMSEPGKKDVGGIEKWTQTVGDSFSKSKANPSFLSEYDIQDPGGVYAGKQPKLITYRLEIFNATWETSLTVIKDGEAWKVDRVSTELR